MDRKDIETTWENTCGDVRAAIGLALDMGLARQKGKTAAQVKRDFFVELAKEVYAAGARMGYEVAKKQFGDD